MAAREKFGSRASAIMAFAGSAIGLGSIWRFPYIMGENGGAAFIIIFIIATLLLSLPIFIAESIIGRRSHSNCMGAMHKLAPGDKKWRILGVLSVFTPLFILSYYSVVGGWSVEYLWQAATLKSKPFTEFVQETWEPLACFGIFVALTALIVAGGVKSGIEKFTKIGIPVLFILIISIAVFSFFLPGAKAGVEYLVKPDFSKITPKLFAYALGQSFYALSLGMGIVITYSSYVSKDENLAVTATGTAVSTLLFSFLAGLAIMPAVFAAGIHPGAGAGLVFESLPYVFSKMSEISPILGISASILFYLTLLLAALTSSVSLLEVGVAWIVEEYHAPRGLACFQVSLLVFIAGALCSLSFGPLARFTLWGNNIFDIFDKFSSNVLLVCGGLLGVLFAGWKMKREDFMDELTNGGRCRMRSAPLIYFLVRYAAPLILIIVFIFNFF